MSDKGPELLKACVYGDVVEARRLIEEGADVHWRDHEYGYTPLMFAAANGRVDVVRLLLDKGADIHHKDNDGGTALHWAARNGEDEVVRLLIERGADLHVKTDNGRTPLFIAKKYNHSSTAAIIEAAMKSKEANEGTFYNEIIKESSALNSSQGIDNITIKNLIQLIENGHHARFMYTYLSQAQKIGAIDRPTRIKYTKMMLDKAVNFVGQGDSIAVFKVILFKAKNDELISEGALDYHKWDQKAENNHTATCDFILEIQQRLHHIESRVNTMEGHIEHIGEALLKLSQSIRKARKIQAVAGFMGAVLNAVTCGIAGSAVSATMNATLGSIVDFSDMGHIKQVIAESALDTSVSESLQAKLTSTADLVANAKIDGGMNKFDDTMMQVLKNLGDEDPSPLVAVAVVVQLANQVTGNNDEKPSGVELLQDGSPNTASMNLHSRIDKVSSVIGIEEIVHNKTSSSFSSLPIMNKISTLEEVIYGEVQGNNVKTSLTRIEKESLNVEGRVDKMSHDIGVEGNSLTLIQKVSMLEENIYGKEMHGALISRVKTLENDLG